MKILLISFFRSNNIGDKLIGKRIMDLFCENNQLGSLDITNNTSLEKLNCKNNQITSLDISCCWLEETNGLICDENVEIIRWENME